MFQLLLNFQGVLGKIWKKKQVSITPDFVILIERSYRVGPNWSFWKKHRKKKNEATNRVVVLSANPSYHIYLNDMSISFHKNLNSVVCLNFTILGEAVRFWSIELAPEQILR